MAWRGVAAGRLLGKKRRRHWRAKKGKKLTPGGEVAFG